MQKLGLRRDIDLALHLPLRYEDETRITPLGSARDGQLVQIEATVTASEVQLRPRRQLLVQVEDATGSCELRFFSFYPSHLKTLAVGARLRIRGEVKGGFWGRQMLHPAFRQAGGELPAALTPVYPTTAGLAQPYLRRAVVNALARVDLSDTLPPGAEPPFAAFRHQNGRNGAWSLREALIFLHHPTPDVALSTLEDHSHPAWQRLKAEELLAQQLSQQQSRRARDMLRAPVLRPAQSPDGALPLHEQLLAVLPFGLTAAQRRVGEEIAADLAHPVPMHRLLQGDVGSGKTVVSALAACLAMDAGWQCALMAPTEILAELGPPAVIQAIAGLAAGTLQGEVQDDSLATYAHKLNKDEARIDWTRPAVELERLIRAFNPWPICHSTLNGEALKVLTATLADTQGAPGQILAASKDGLIVGCGEGALCLTRLQLPGGKALNFSDFFNSRREKFAVGTVLGAAQ